MIARECGELSRRYSRWHRASLVLVIFNVSAINILDLYYAPLASRSIYRLDATKIGKCLLNKAQIDQDIQLTGKLSGQTGPIASQCGTIFFSDMSRTSILCANASKRIDSNNSVSHVLCSCRLPWLFTSYSVEQVERLQATVLSPYENQFS